MIEHKNTELKSQQQMNDLKAKQDLRKTLPFRFFIGISIIIVVGAGIFGYYNYTVKYPRTDDAYVSANLVNVSPKVGGFIKHIYVTKNQKVYKGDKLLDIDPVDYNLEVALRSQNVAYAQQQSDVTKKNIALAEVNIKKAQADYEFYNKMAKRYTILFNAKAGTEQDMQKWINNATQAKQQLNQTKLSYQQAQRAYQATLSQINVYKAELATAVTKTSYTDIIATVNGYITNLNLADGQLIQAGQNIFGIIDDASWWIDANFKETQIARIKPGQKVRVKLDMYDHEYTGIVDSISRGSGNTFSILPAQNATGNWVKVTQRFAVVIKVKDDPKFPMRVGSSAFVIIDTTK